jgi:hypothetical protein
MTDFWKYFEQEAEPRLDKRAKMTATVQRSALFNALVTHSDSIRTSIQPSPTAFGTSPLAATNRRSSVSVHQARKRSSS